MRDAQIMDSGEGVSYKLDVRHSCVAKHTKEPCWAFPISGMSPLVLLNSYIGKFPKLEWKLQVSTPPFQVQNGSIVPRPVFGGRE